MDLGTKRTKKIPESSIFKFFFFFILILYILDKQIGR